MSYNKRENKKNTVAFHERIRYNVRKSVSAFALRSRALVCQDKEGLK